MSKYHKWAFFVAFLCLASGAWLGYRWLTPSFVPPVLPAPNGYDDLLRAAEMLAPRTGFYDEMQPEELAAVVAQNQPALALAREGLKKGIGVTIDWSCNPAAGGDQAHFDNLPAMKKLSRALGAVRRDGPILICRLSISTAAAGYRDNS